MSEKISPIVAILDEISSEGRRLPSLVVFDLDQTLWPFYCDCMYGYTKPWLFSEAMDVIGALRDAGVPMAIASRTSSPDIAQLFLDTLGISELFPIKEMYPTRTYKSEHFAAIQKKTGVPYAEMLFFDDEDPNIKTVTKLGVTCIRVDNRGVCFKSAEMGLRKFSLS